MAIFLLLASPAVFASIPPLGYDIPTGVAPAFFGPNAFPVPDMSDGSTSPYFKIEAYSDNFWGTAVKGQDYTSSLFTRLTIPCFSPRVNLVMWGNVAEYCISGPEANRYRGISYDGTLRDCYAGDFYMSADIMVLMQERSGVDMTARMALKTASGHRYHYARYYDSPGYYFDASIGRTFRMADDRISLRLALSTGFLCWQTHVSRQNDAVMYGAYAALTAGGFKLSAEYGGYTGWERYGDAPMTLKTSMSYAFGNLSLRLLHQVGFADWPFHQVRIGAEYRFCFNRKN